MVLATIILAGCGGASEEYYQKVDEEICISHGLRPVTVPLEHKVGQEHDFQVLCYYSNGDYVLPQDLK